MTPITLLFFSSADISLPLFEKLLRDDRFKVVGLFCQPDKPAGRNLLLKKPHIKEIAEKHHIPVYQPENLGRATDLLEKQRENSPDFLVTFAYGKILNENWLSLPKKHALNVHTSLLPKYRGSSPIQNAILNGDSETGISLMQMEKTYDTGPVYATHRIKLEKNWTASFLHEELAELAAQKIPEDLVKLMSDSAPQFQIQDSKNATMTEKMKKDDGYLDFQESAELIHRKFLAYTPWPGLWTFCNGKRLKFIDLKVCALALAPGEVQCKDKKLFIGTLEGAIEVLQLQMEGKKTAHADQFVLGQPTFCSQQLPSKEKES